MCRSAGLLVLALGDRNNIGPAWRRTLAIFVDCAARALKIGRLHTGVSKRVVLQRSETIPYLLTTHSLFTQLVAPLALAAIAGWVLIQKPH